MRSRLFRAALPLSLALACVGCSLLPKPLDMPGLEAQFVDQMNAKFKDAGVTFTVDCPEHVNAESGGTFDCTATSSGGDTVILHVTQTDRDGHVTYILDGPASPTPSP